MICFLMCCTEVVEVLQHERNVMGPWLNLPQPGQNGRHFVDDLFRCILVNNKFCILIKI